MKRRVCVYCEMWESGGIESFLYNVLRRMDRSGFEIDLVTAEKRESVFTAELERAGIRFEELSGNVRNIPQNHRLFEKLLFERGYDVLHLNAFHGMSLYYIHLAKQMGVPVRIAHSHNTDLRKSRGRRIKLALHGMYRKRYTVDATALWACSKAAAEFMFDADVLAERGYRFIPNGIDTERFRFRADVRERVRVELGLSDKLVLGNVGRLCYQKNQSFLLDVLKELLTQRPKSVLLLVGEGEDRTALEEKAKRLGISGSVVFYGTSSRVEELMCAMDVFVFPSLFEGLPVVMVEAQCAGLPVLCSEQMTEEASITNIEHISLYSGATFWAKTILNMITENNVRETCAEKVYEAGFDITNCTNQILRKYTT